VPEGDVLKCGDGVAPQNTGETGEPFPRDGIALVRHGAAALLAFSERLLGFEHLGALEMAELDGPSLDARANERQRELKFRMDVALDDLSGDGRGLEAELFADEILDVGRQVRAGADGAGQFADVGSPWMPWLRPMQGVI
jgi:hypothetical protein